MADSHDGFSDQPRMDKDMMQRNMDGNYCDEAKD